MTLPNPFLGVQTTKTEPIQHDEPGGGVILLRRMTEERVDEKTVVLTYEHLTSTELALVMAAYADGDGLCAPFAYTVPGESSSSNFVLAKPPEVVFESATVSRVVLELTQI